MKADESLKTRVMAVAQALRAEPPEAAREALSELNRALIDLQRVDLDRLSGLVVTVAGKGRLEAVGTDGKTQELDAESAAIFQPSLLPQSFDSDGDDGVLAVQPRVSSTFFLCLRNLGKVKAKVTIDASGVTRSFARWGVMRLVVNGGRKFEPFLLGVDKTELVIPKGDEIHIFGTGYSPRIDPHRIFSTSRAGEPARSAG